MDDQNQHLKEEFTRAKLFKPLAEVRDFVRFNEFLASLYQRKLSESLSRVEILSSSKIISFSDLQFHKLGLELFGTMEIFPEYVQPVSDQQGYNCQDSSQSDDNSDKWVGFDLGHISVLIYVLIRFMLYWVK